MSGLVAAQDRPSPQGARSLLRPADLAKLRSTLEELLIGGELRQVIATVAGLETKLAVPKHDARHALCLEIDRLAKTAEIALEFATVRTRYLSAADFSKLTVRLKDLLAAGKVHLVMAATRHLRSKLAVPKRDPRYPLRMKIESLGIQAKTRLPIASLRFGVLRQDNQGYGIILDGEVFEVGERVRPNLTLKHIGPTGVEFAFHGKIHR